MTQVRQRSDFLSSCKAADARNPALEEIRDKGAEIILAVFRMLKNSLVHDVDNSAVRNIVKETHTTLIDFAQTVGGQIAVTFVDDTIFVCGQLLRASRSIYESAREVGRLLGVVGVSEITFSAQLTTDDLTQLCRDFSLSSRDPHQRGHLLSTPLQHIAVRAVTSELTNSQDDRHLPPMERALGAYAAALIAMQQFFERVALGRAVMPHRIKRIAQRLVSLAEGDQMAMLALTSLANAHRDDAGRAVQSAILAVLTTRKLTESRAALSQVAMTALLADLGRVRLAGPSSLERYIRLGDDIERAVPAMTAALSMAVGGVNLPNAMRTVIAHESLQLERSHLLGAPYARTMSPLFQARIVHVARTLLNRIAPRDGGRALSPLDGLAALAEDPTVDPTACKLLVQAIGLLPTGTVVEFETGEWGVVLGPSSHPEAATKPRVNVITDRHGEVLARPKAIDLGEPGRGRRFPPIVAVIEPERARFNLSAALLA